MNNLVHICLCVFGVPSRCISRRGFLSLKAEVMLLLPDFSAEGLVLLTFPSACRSMPISPQRRGQNWSLYLKNFASVVGEKWHFSVVLICISLILSKLEHFLI